MAKKVRAIVKLQIPAAEATPAPPVGPALGQHGVNIMNFVKEYNSRTGASKGTIVPVQVTIFEDRSFTFVTKTPPASELLKKAADVEKGSQESLRVKRRHGHPEPGPGDRSHQAAGPQRRHRGERHTEHRGDGPQHGHPGRGGLA